MFQKRCAPGKRIVFQNSFTLRNTASWEVGKGESRWQRECTMQSESWRQSESRRQRESRRQVPWGLAFTSYFLFSCACPKYSLFERMNHWMSEGISEHDNCTGLCDGLFIRAVTSAVTCAVTSAATFARSLQHLARSAIGVAHDDRAALFTAD